MSTKHKNIFLRLWHLLLNPNFWVWAMPIILIMPNIGLAITEYNSWQAKVTDIILPLGIYMMVMGFWKRTGWMIWILFPVAVLCAFQIVLLYLYGEGIIAIDMFLNVMTTNVGEATELLENLKIALVTVFVLYLPPLVFGTCLIVKHRVASRTTLRRSLEAGMAVTIIGFIWFLITWFCVDSYRPMREVFPVNVTSNLCTSISRKSQSNNYHHTSADYTYGAVSERDSSLQETYVFVIGETSRADNWSLFGYGRDTNPRLSKRQGLIGFGRTLSEINTTHKSVPMLMSDLQAGTFNDSVNIVRSIFEAFNTSGYDTYFISNQRRNHSYIDFFGEEARHAYFITDHAEGPAYDIDLATQLDSVLSKSKSKKVFVILHAYGSHFEYRKRYPVDARHFIPESNSEASRVNRGQLMNAYDNTIRYNDMVLDSIISVLERRGGYAGMIYASDHGEDIFDDDRERFLHASPVPTYWQLHVPLVMWMSESLAKAHPALPANARRNSGKLVSSSRSMFHSTLQMAGLRTPHFNGRASVLSPDYTPVAPVYLNDYNESVPLTKSGLRPEDMGPLNRLLGRNR